MSTPKIPGYVVAEKLGAGSYAEVYKAFNCNNVKDVVAIKCVEKSKLSKTGLDNLISEIKILKNLNHDHVVKLRDFTHDDSYVFLIMEYCSGGSLSSLIQKHQRLPEHLCQRFLQQLVKALKYLREQHISHFDLKPQNILLASKRLQILKIADFGLAQSMAEGDTTTLIKGSPLYMAPEIVLKNQYDARADIWSVGIILYECLFGKAPYSSKSFEELISKIKVDNPIDIPSNSNISTDCRNFLNSCLERDVSTRLDFENFFSHPFVGLEYAPSSESFSKATHHLNEAISFEKSSKLVEAFNSYNEAIKYLIPLMYSESEVSKRLKLKRKIAEYVNRMETLKKKHTVEDIKHIKMVNVPSNITRKETKILYEGNLSELINLTKSTPQMTTAIEIAHSAELYEKEEKYSLALEKYELALGKLLTLLQNEPKGRRKELLLSEMNKWMDRAERLKEFENLCSNQEVALKLQDNGNHSSLPEGDIEKNCSIQ